MTIRKKGGQWPAEIAPPGATVRSTAVDPANGYLVLDLRHPANNRSVLVTLPTPWTFSSCLLSAHSEKFSESESATIAADDLIGLEGAALSGIECGADRIDLVFGSIRLSVTSDSP